MRKKPTVILFSTLLIILGAGIFVFSRARDTPPEMFSGTVSKTSNDCYADGNCSITLSSGKVIITGCGLKSDGTTCATYDQSKLKSGDKITVKAIKDETSAYTIDCAGCSITKQ